MRKVQDAHGDAEDRVPSVSREKESSGARAIRVVAHMRGPITGPPMLDALLAYVVAEQRGLVAGFGPMVRDIEIPIAKEPGGRFHLVTSPMAAFDQHEARWVNRKFPLGEGQMFGDAKLKRVHISAGACKSYRIPHEVKFVMGDQIVWYATGDAAATRELLSYVTHLGRRRAVGRGAVREWTVDAVAPEDAWEGFPVARDGKALRPLPIAWPGLVEPAEILHTLTFPYWEHAREEPCAVPG